MDTSIAWDRLQRMRDRTQRAIHDSERLIRGTTILLAESLVSYRTSRALLQGLAESRLGHQVDEHEPDRRAPASKRS